MKIVKEAAAGGMGTAVDAQVLSQINALSRRTLQAEEVYTFCVRLCDNEVDRDYERFPVETLEEQSRLFVGKSGMFDHQWSARGQAARLYRTELVREEGLLTRAGDPYCYLKGYAYMLRTQANRELIEEIEGGIKKEVSISCAVARTVCSVCGEEARGCAHVKGQEYGGKLCWSELIGATDAYEWSFVAVPAQPKAGVLKGLQQRERLEQEAALGRKYLEGLRWEVVRLGGLAEPELGRDVCKSIAEKLGETELLALKKNYERRLSERFPVKTQLEYAGPAGEGGGKDGAFLI